MEPGVVESLSHRVPIVGVDGEHAGQKGVQTLRKSLGVALESLLDARVQTLLVVAREGESARDALEETHANGPHVGL